MGNQGLDPGWELVLLASLNSKRVVMGRVRANKQVARLQMNGVPVPIRFRNIQMGPASLQIDERAKKAQEKGFLELKTSTGKAGFERHDYLVTDAGVEYTQNVILPTLQESSYGPAVLEGINDVAQEHLYLKDQQLVDMIHQDLHLDDREELMNVYEETYETLNRWARTSKDKPIRDKVILAASGAVDFAIMALEATRRFLIKEEEQRTGPYIVLYNAQRLSWLLSSLDCLHTKRHKNDTALVRRFDRILNALEFNCSCYGILDVPSDEEIDAMFEEAAPFIPDPDTS